MNKAIPNTPDQVLFSQAVLAFTNFERCKRSLGLLSLHNGLVSEAQLHSKWMARAKNLSHTSNVAGRTKAKNRVRAAGISAKMSAENISQRNRYAFGATTFRATNASRCQFVTTKGASIPAYSYATLARNVVSAWMKSSGHRRNLTHRRASMMGAGVAHDKSAPNCGQLYVTQLFAG
jgi:uncharacterized protein YkwD